MIRKPGKLLEVGDSIFLGPNKNRSRVLKIGERCQTELVEPALRKYVRPEKRLEIWVKLGQSEEVAELGWRVGFFTVYLPPEQIVRVVERDSQRAAR